MLATVLIVFRESLEAALFVGIIAAATQGLSGRRWLGAGVGAGVLGALVLALLAQRISGWLDGLGHGLIGYDARPSVAQLASYLGVLLLIRFGTRLLSGRSGSH